MTSTVRIDVPMNRVEGDLRVSAEIDDGIVTEAWTSGTMYRGFEKILVGRGARDGLVITPRICGICTTGHLTAAALALDAITGAVPPPDAVRVRNLLLSTEHVQSDMRHAVLSFAADFTNPWYEGTPLFAEAVRRFEPLQGEAVIEVIRETRKVLEIVAILGGQWPHSSYMVPGGIVSVPSSGDLIQCRLRLKRYRDWYEKRVLGCSLARWSEVASRADLDAWLEEHPEHQEGILGFFIRFSRAAGLERFGRSHDTYVSFGGPELPTGNGSATTRLYPAGFRDGMSIVPFDGEKIREHVAYSWYVDQGTAEHPAEGDTRPYATGNEGKKYSWAKAPRYDGRPAETGPLAEALMGMQPLFLDLSSDGANVFVRELARMVRPAWLLPLMDRCLADLNPGGSFYISPGEVVDGAGAGLTHASRGALGHWVRIRDGVIEGYQIITPTAWNASPRDTHGVRGPMEEALVGTPVMDPDNPVELGHVVRSFDACLVCTVHAIRKGTNRTVTVRMRP